MQTSCRCAGRGTALSDIEQKNYDWLKGAYRKAATEVDVLRIENERLQIELTIIGDKAVVDWDDETIGQVDAALQGQLQGKPLTKYIEWRRQLEDQHRIDKEEIERLKSSLKKFAGDVSDGFECLPNCDSYGHEELCPRTNPEAAWAQMQAELKELRTKKPVSFWSKILNTMMDKLGTDDEGLVKLNSDTYAIHSDNAILEAELEHATEAVIAVQTENRRLRRHLKAVAQETPGEGDACVECNSDERVATSSGLCPWCARDKIKQLQDAVEKAAEALDMLMCFYLDEAHGEISNIHSDLREAMERKL